MGRPRKAAKILDAKGAFKKDPNRKREDLKGVGEIGEAPEDFSELERLLWERLKGMVPPGIITGSDELLLEAGARYWAKLRQTNTDELTASQIAQIIGVCNALCISPQARTKVAPPETKKKNSFEGF